MAQPDHLISAGTGIYAVTRKAYLCKACGGRTRFQVVRVLRISEYEHLEVSGDLKQAEEVEVISEVIEAVSCRWCGHGDRIVELDSDGNEKPLQLGEQVGLLPNPDQ